MPLRPRRIGILCGLLCLALAVPAPAADEPADQPKEKSVKPEKAKPKEAKPEEKADPFVVPDGTPEELFAYVEKLQRMGPVRVRSREDLLFLVDSRQAMLKAAEKILAGKPTEEQFTKAAGLKLGCLNLLANVRAPGMAENAADFAEALSKAGKTKLARTARAIAIMAEARNPGDVEALKKLLAKTQEFLAGGPLTRRELGLMMAVAQALEYSDQPKLAAEAYKEFAKMASKSDDGVVARYAARMEAAARRMELPGNPIKIEGLTLEGREFDWEKFSKGKVVLVDFWATWCGWCIREIPAMKELYGAYHDRGFEIVGLCGDDTRQALDAFLEKTEVPWTILYGKEGPSETIQYYGITAFPTVLLVDKEGKVVSLHARGDKLREDLARLLGPIEAEKPEKKEPGKEEEQEQKGEKPEKE